MALETLLLKISTTQWYLSPINTHVYNTQTITNVLGYFVLRQYDLIWIDASVLCGLDSTG